MKRLLLALLVLAPLALFADNSDLDTGIVLLNCEQITLAKSSFHVRVDQYNAGPHAEFLMAFAFFNVETEPRIKFNKCNGMDPKAVTCFDETGKKSLRVFTKGSDNQFIVATIQQTDVPSVFSFVCEKAH